MKDTMNATEVLNNINACIEELEQANNSFKLDCRRMSYKGCTDDTKVFNIRAVYRELSIFDWWNDKLSMSQLKQMKSFVKTAIKLGFTEDVYFKVGAAGCSHGMWAHREKSTDALFHSFRSGDNYYDMKLNDVWMHNKYATKENYCPTFTLKQIKTELKKEVAWWVV